MLDNIGTLDTMGWRTNRARQPVQDWTLEMRLRGYSILLIHHTGKSGINVELQPDRRPDGAIKLMTPGGALDEGATSMMLTYIKPLRHARRQADRTTQTDQTDGFWEWEAAEIKS